MIEFEHLSDAEVITEAERLCKLADNRAGEVLRLHLGLDRNMIPRSVEEVGKIFELTAERIDQILRIAMRQIDEAEPGVITPTVMEMQTRLQGRITVLEVKTYLRSQSP